QPATAGAGTTNCADLDPSGTGMPAVGAANFFVNAAPGDQILVVKTDTNEVGLSPNIRVTPPGGVSAEFPLPVTINVGAGQGGLFTIDDDPFNASITVTCTVGGAAAAGGDTDTTTRTQSGINNFQINRGNQILNADPDLAERRTGGARWQSA
ncbi:MAG: hypothetical protein AAFO79_12510, partial [Pseudomonadota bacterium]